jgi:acyl-homoserine-lactone acylase
MYKIVLLCLLYLISSSIFAQSPKKGNLQKTLVDPNNITIARDKWGVPHIFAPTDPAAAYGLAWANAEDAFEQMQDLLLLGKQMMGRKNGKDGAAIDFFVHSIGADQTYDEKVSQLSKEYLDYVQGYCEGINAFAAKYPERVLLKKAFPITSEDVIKTYLVAFSALTGNADQVQNIMEGKYDQELPSSPAGSNAYAFAPQKTTNGNTFLCINPHFKIQGGFSFYEAHIQSEEGLNMTGALFQGGTSIFMGNNEHLGWGKTYNHTDQVDVFELEMHPKKKLHYKVDGEYLKLEKRPVWLKVKIGFMTIPVKKMTYYSIYGPTYRSPAKRFFSVRSPAFFNLHAGEQYYEMNKATNYQEFRAAINKNHMPMFNIVYGDKEGTIYYICNATLPKRNSSYDYSGVLKGDTKQNLWTTYYPQKELPSVHNPNCGYVFNTNNTPRTASCKPTDCQEEVLKYADTRNGENNRSIRFMELMDESKQYSWEEFKAIKFDTKISKNWIFWSAFQPLFDLNPEEYPPLEEAIKLLQNWDGDASRENTTAALFLLSFQYVFDKQGYSDAVFTTGIEEDIPQQLFIEGIEHASKILFQQYGSLKVPLGEVVLHERNGKLYPASGFPDALSPIYTKANAEGKQVAEYGDTYIHYVEFDKDGAKTIETLLPFENTPTSEDYEDELEMFNNRQLKKMSLNKAEILKNAVKVYHPKPN